MGLNLLAPTENIWDLMQDNAEFLQDILTGKKQNATKLKV
jgi:hypothetical protein